MSRSYFRLPFLFLAVVSLLFALWAGLLRMGWAWPVLQPMLPMSHGPLMASGFFGTLISLERAVALKKRWPYAGPIFSGAGGILLILGIGGMAGPLLLTLGSLWLVAIFIYIIRTHAAGYTITMGVGSLCWLVGSFFWLGGRSVYQVVGWWVAFLVLTIAGERLELSRLSHLSSIHRLLFGVGIGILMLGVATSPINLVWGDRISGVSVIGLAAWLLRFDVARKTIKQVGLTRYIAACLLSGYFWLAVGGVFLLLFAGYTAGVFYDARLHAILVGFVFSMIFGHAPIIFPAILNVPILYRAYFYVPLVLLHGSLLLRILGDLAGWLLLRQWGGLLNAVATLAFLATMMVPKRIKSATHSR